MTTLRNNAAFGAIACGASGIPIALAITFAAPWDNFSSSEIVSAFFGVAIFTVGISGSFGLTYGIIIYLILAKFGLANVLSLAGFGAVGGIGFLWVWNDPRDVGENLVLFGTAGAWAGAAFWYGAERWQRGGIG